MYNKTRENITDISLGRHLAPTLSYALNPLRKLFVASLFSCRIHLGSLT